MTDTTPAAEPASSAVEVDPEAPAPRTVGELATSKFKPADRPQPPSTTSTELAVTSDQMGDDTEAGLHKRFVKAFNELQFVSEQPSSLRDVVALAARGDWTTAETGPARTLAQIHATAVQVPLLTVAYFIAWSCRSPARLWTVFALVNTVGAALNAIPVINLVIPDWLTWGFWPPFCWIL